MILVVVLYVILSPCVYTLTLSPLEVNASFTSETGNWRSRGTNTLYPDVSNLCHSFVVAVNGTLGWEASYEWHIRDGERLLKINLNVFYCVDIDVSKDSLNLTATKLHEQGNSWRLDPIAVGMYHNGYLLTGADVKTAVVVPSMTLIHFEFAWRCTVPDLAGLKLVSSGSTIYVDSTLSKGSYPPWATVPNRVECVGEVVYIFMSPLTVYTGSVPVVWKNDTSPEVRWNGVWGWGSVYQQQTHKLYSYPTLQTYDTLQITGNWYQGPEAPTCDVSPFLWTFKDSAPTFTLPTTFSTVAKTIKLACHSDFCPLHAPCELPLQFRYAYPPTTIKGAQLYLVPPPFLPLVSNSPLPLASSSLLSKIKPTSVLAPPRATVTTLAGGGRLQVHTTYPYQNQQAEPLNTLTISPGERIVMVVQPFFDGSATHVNTPLTPWTCKFPIFHQFSDPTWTAAYEVTVKIVSTTILTYTITMDAFTCMDFFNGQFYYNITNKVTKKELHSSDYGCTTVSPAIAITTVYDINVADQTWSCHKPDVLAVVPTTSLKLHISEEGQYAPSMIVDMTTVAPSIIYPEVTGFRFGGASQFNANGTCPPAGCTNITIQGNMVFSGSEHNNDDNNSSIELSINNDFLHDYASGPYYYEAVYRGFADEFTFPWTQNERWELTYDQTDHNILEFTISEDTPFPSHFTINGSFPIHSSGESGFNITINSTLKWPSLYPNKGGQGDWNSNNITFTYSPVLFECDITDMSFVQCSLQGLQDVIERIVLLNAFSLSELNNMGSDKDAIIVFLEFPTEMYVSSVVDPTGEPIFFLHSVYGPSPFYIYVKPSNPNIFLQFWYIWVGAACLILLAIVAVLVYTHKRRRKGFIPIKDVEV